MYGGNVAPKPEFSYHLGPAALSLKPLGSTLCRWLRWDLDPGILEFCTFQTVLIPGKHSSQLFLWLPPFTLECSLA